MKNMTIPGSYTVEASFLFSLIFLFLALVINWTIGWQQSLEDLGLTLLNDALKDNYYEKVITLLRSVP